MKSFILTFIIYKIFICDNIKDSDITLNESFINKSLITGYRVYQYTKDDLYSQLNTFEVDIIYNIKIKKKFQTFQYFNVSDYPDSNYWVTFIIRYNDALKINFKIINQNGALIYSNDSVTSDLINFKPLKNEKITFIFENYNDKELDLIIGYDCVNCKPKKEYSKNSDILQSINIFDNIKKIVSNINIQNINIDNSNREVLSEISYNNKKHYKWVIFEFLLIITIYGIQIYFIFSFKNKNILI